MTSFIISCLPQKVVLVVQFTEPFFPPPFPPPLTPSGDAVPYSQVQGLHCITHHFQSLAAFNYPLQPTSCNKQCCFGLCQITSRRSLPHQLPCQPLHRRDGTARLQPHFCLIVHMSLSHLRCSPCV